MPDEKAPKKIAIACQGGATHTAFTAGALIRLLEEIERSDKPKYEIVALSGTSGGAICALATWAGLAVEYPDVKKGARRAIKALNSIWLDNAATFPWDQVWNNLLVTFQEMNVWSPFTVNLNPYHYPPFFQTAMKEMLERTIPFAELNEKKPVKPLLLVAAAAVLSGEFKLFSNLAREATGDMGRNQKFRLKSPPTFDESEKGINVKTILASGAIPEMVPAVHIGNECYWDALYSESAPIRELPNAYPEETYRPDEIWIIQVLPNCEDQEPRTVAAIMDRKMEMEANISLEQEVYHIKKFNELIQEGAFKDERKYRYISIKRIELKEELDRASMINRDIHFIQRLVWMGDWEMDNFLRL